MTVGPGVLSGTLQAPGSKSDAHRCLIAAALASQPTRFLDLPSGQDIEATLRCLKALGAQMDADSCTMHPMQPGTSALMLCGESGTTLRLLLPLTAALGIQARFIGEGGLPTRPLGPLLDALIAHGAMISAHTLPLTVSGRLRPGTYTLPGDVSSQFVSGLLFALSAIDTGGTIVLTTPLQSAGYVEMTMDTMDRFSVMTIQREDGYFVPGNQRFRTPGEIKVERDWSNAAVFLGAGAMGGDLSLQGLRMASHQPDRQILSLLEQFGAAVSHAENTVRVRQGSLRGIRIDVSQMPDLVPMLAVVAAVAQGDTQLVGAARLRLKESDRLETTAAMLTALGARVTLQADAMTIHGGPRLQGGTVDCAGDHRIVMAAAIAATVCEGPVTLLGAEAVEKSYPTFFADYQRMGGACNVLDDR